LAKVTTYPKMPLNKVDLRQCLTVWADHPEASNTEVTSQTGLSKKRVSSAKQWAMLGNLLNSQGLTDIGRLALEKDPYLEATVTDWVIHFFCSLNGKGLQSPPDKPSDWGLWTFVVYDFLDKNLSFTEEELVQSASQALGDGNLEEQAKICLKSYVQKDGLSNCRFLSHSDNLYKIGNPSLQNSFVIGYLLSIIWQRDFGDQTSLLVNNLLGMKMGLSQVLGVQEPQLRDQLDRLAELEVIEQRSAKPHKIGTQTERKQDEEMTYIVVRCWNNPLELLAKAYEQDPAIPNRPLSQALEGILDDDDGDLPFLSSVHNWLLSFRPQQSQFASESPPFDPPLHLAG
jgi:hypothetical protein